MQTIKTKSQSKTKLLISALIIVVLLIGVVVFADVNKFGPFAVEKAQEDSSVDYGPPSEEQVGAGNPTKETIAKTENTKPGPSQSSSSTSTNSNTGTTIGVEITNEPKNNNGSLSVKTLVQEVNSTGVCTLTLSKSGQKSVIKTAKTQVSGSVATCQGFIIDVRNLENGRWSIRIDYKSDKSVGNTSESVAL